MISNVLSDAVEAIQDYQREVPGWYDDLHDEIAVVLAVMESLQIYLDSSPSVSDEHRTRREDLRRAIAALDVADLRRAIA